MDIDPILERTTWDWDTMKQLVQTLGYHAFMAGWQRATEEYHGLVFDEKCEEAAITRARGMAWTITPRKYE